jgi:drug/metabolite transporter (DMT)-like permease
MIAFFQTRTASMMAAVFAVSVWAAWIPMTRLGVTTNLAPADLAALRFFTAAILLLPVLWRHFRLVPWHRPFALFWLMAGAGVPYILAFGYGLKIANSGQGGILGPGAMPIFVSIFAALFLKEIITRQRRLGIALGSVGVAIILGFDMAHGAVRLEGFFLILLASCLWATHTIASRSLALPPMTSTMIVSVGNGLLLLPFYALMGGFSRLAAAPIHDVALQAAFQGIVVSIFALVAFAFAVRRLGASSTGVFTPLTPVFASLMGYFLLGDKLDGPTILGLVLVFCGVVIAVRAPTPVAPQPAP